MGFESGSPRILENMNKRYHPEEVRRISEILKKYSIKRMGFLLLGGPGETGRTVRESLEYADSLELESMKITVGIRIYPHTSLARQAAQEGLIKLDESLLSPAFYVSRELRTDLPDMVAGWIEDRPNWFY